MPFVWCAGILFTDPALAEVIGMEFAEAIHAGDMDQSQITGNAAQDYTMTDGTVLTLPFGIEGDQSDLLNTIDSMYDNLASGAAFECRDKGLQV